MPNWSDRVLDTGVLFSITAIRRTDLNLTFSTDGSVPGISFRSLLSSGYYVDYYIALMPP